MAKEDIFGDLLPATVSTVRAASSLAAQDVNFYRSVDATLCKDIDSSATKLMDIANSLIQTASEDSTTIEFGKENISSDIAWNLISNVLDNLFEKIDICFDDEIKGRNKLKSNESITYLEDSNNTDSRSDSRHAEKRLPKPQLNFRNKVDNSEQHPFKPKITSKPHALKPFEESMKLVVPEQDENTDEIDPPHYEQPYENEIDSQHYPESVLVESTPISPKEWESTSAIWVDTKEKLDEMIRDLSELTEIAVDLEHHDYRTYYGIVCLMQISNREKDWIIDTLALRDDLEPLNIIFTNPNIVKVFHGAFMDIIWLQRDLGLYIVSLFDTYHASKKLGFSKFSLAYLLETFANFKTSKKYQLADWRVRPLLSPMLAYARSDTHFLLYIYDQLKNKLLESGNGKLQEVLYESRQVAKRRFEFTSFRPLSKVGSKVSCPIMASNPKEPYGSIIYQYNIPLHKKPVVEVLYNWRDMIARKEDESVRFIMPNQLLVSLATLSSPVDVSKVLNVATYVTDFVRIHAKELSELIESTLKKVEDNDWELVDKWNNDSNDDEIEMSNLTKEDLISSMNNFKLLNKSKLLQDASNLLDKTSLIFNFGDDRYSIEYNPESKKITKLDTKDVLRDRHNYAMEVLLKIDENMSMVLAAPESPEVQEKEEEKVTAKEEDESQDELNENNNDPNEIITLRKVQNRNNQANSKYSKNVSEESSFDYANADKILLDTKKRFDSLKDSKKKRTFDPYNKDGDGPRAAKKSRKLNSGKTSTFSDKRRR